ncbi:MAG TPA: GNAT family N-acetyltransferase [Kineosporiaceae bacterium]|nr:GNAT family N-acetyltransferase [Kineosporiaceae bacterium]
MDLPAWAPTLTDGVVTLRPHRPEDADAVVAQCHDPQMQRWTTVPAPYERRHAEEWLSDRPREWAQGTNLALAVESGGAYCGSVDLRPDGARGASIGYGLGPWARGRGVLDRALRLLLPWGFDVLDLEVVHWQAVAGNWPSRRAAWRVGFRFEGTQRSLLPGRGTRYDAWVGSLLRGEPLEPASAWLDAPVLDGERVRLRPYRPVDVPRVVEACRDPVTRHWLSSLPAGYAADDARAHLEHIAEEAAAGRSLSWAIADPGDDRLLGEVGLYGLVEFGRSVEVAYWSHPAERGRGVMTAAVRLAARHALVPVDVGGLGRSRLVLRAAEHNQASRRVAVRAGFLMTGRDRQAELLGDGTVDDLVRFDLLATELPG